MSKNKSTRAGVAASAREGRVSSTCEAVNTHYHNNMALAENQSRLWAVLLHGHENAQTAAELARVLEWTPRQVTRTIQQLRRKGKPIAAYCLDNSRRGYYIADREELQSYLCCLLRRITEIEKTADATAETLERMDE